jgi:DNA repair exonuclease SbcCD ATPase subunit
MDCCFIQKYGAATRTIEELRDAVTGKDGEIGMLTNHLAVARNELAAAKAQHASTKLALENVRQLCTRRNVWCLIVFLPCAFRPQQISGLTGLLDNKKRDCRELNEALTDVRAQLNEKENQLFEVGQRHSARECELLAEIAEARGQADEFRQQYHEQVLLVRAEYDTVNSRLQLTMQQLHEAECEIERSQATIAANTTVIEKLKSRLQVAEDERDAAVSAKSISDAQHRSMQKKVPLQRPFVALPIV